MSWNGETIHLRLEVTGQLRQNYIVNRGIHPSSHIAINRNSLPQISSTFMHYMLDLNKKSVSVICARFSNPLNGYIFKNLREIIFY